MIWMNSGERIKRSARNMFNKKNRRKETLREIMTRRDLRRVEQTRKQKKGMQRKLLMKKNLRLV